MYATGYLTVCISYHQLPNFVQIFPSYCYSDKTIWFLFFYLPPISVVFVFSNLNQTFSELFFSSFCYFNTNRFNVYTFNYKYNIVHFTWYTVNYMTWAWQQTRYFHILFDDLWYKGWGFHMDPDTHVIMESQCI